MLVFDGITNVSMSNGLVRVAVSRVGADGAQHPAGEIAIPANQFGNILNGLQNAGQQLQERINQQQTNAAEQTEEERVE